ncbi:MAG TPA: helix-turn-helix domain-containing protein [Thermoanaerobaculia bacterium]|nr:helix-turn-helix domain-containing protein [Thermoanaerobaculia bacterium]
MKEAIRICAVLLRAGAVSGAELPELERPEVRSEVERRLHGVGLVLATSPWSDLVGVRLDPEVAADPAFETAANLGLGEDACALLVVLWVRLVFARSGSAGGEGLRPLVRMDNLARELRSLLGDRRHIRSLVVQLRQLGLLAGQGDVIEAGPLLELAIDSERMIAFLRAGVLAGLLIEREKPEPGDKANVLSRFGSQVLDVLREQGGSAGMTELVRETGAPASRLRLVLRGLAEAGHVRRSGERRSARYHIAE